MSFLVWRYNTEKQIKMLNFARLTLTPHLNPTAEASCLIFIEVF